MNAEKKLSLWDRIRWKRLNITNQFKRTNKRRFDKRCRDGWHKFNMKVIHYPKASINYLQCTNCRIIGIANDKDRAIYEKERKKKQNAFIKVMQNDLS